MRLISRLLAVCLLSTPVFTASHAADNFPVRPVRLIVPFPAGGTLDTVARLVGQGLGKAWGQSIVVDNRPGGAAIIGTQLASNAPPDGHTLLFMANGFVIVPMLMRQAPYDPFRDFAPISLLGRVNQALVAQAGFKAGSLKDLIALAKNQPGKLTFASFGIGTSSHLAVELFKKEAGIDMTHVPYKGVAPALADLLGGQVDVFFTNLPEVVPHVQSGRLKALAVADAKRVVQLPDVPTFAEQGFPSFNVYSWYGAVAPAGTSDAVVRKLNNSIVAVLKEVERSEQVRQQALVMVGSTPGELTQYMRREQAKYADVIRAAGVRID